MKNKAWARVFAILLLAVLGASAQAAELRLGVLANRGELEATGRWSELAAYLSRELGEPVTLVPLPPAKVAAAATSGRVDFVFSHSPHTVLVKETLGGTVLATLNTPAGARFGGVIIAKKGSGIEKAEDLRGKNVMSLKFKAAAGAYIFQTYHLLQKGIDPHKDFGSLREGKKQDDLVLAVKNGLIDAAFVRTGLLEAMEKEGKIRVDEFVVVDRREDPDFPLLHSTRLYPEWCFTALPNVPAQTVERTKAALMKIEAGSEVARKGRMRGFVEPQPLDGMAEALKVLKIAPYDS